MKKIGIILLLLSIFLVACTREEANKKETVPPTMPTEGTTPPATADIPNVIATPPPTLADREREQAELDEKRRRKGEIKMDNLENVGVEGSLRKGVMALLEAVKNQDNEGKLKLHYDSNWITFDALEEPYILEFTKIALDNTELKGMIDEHNLLSFSSDVAIVEITTKALNLNLEESLSTGKYIFVKVDGQWKVFRTF
ncbi:hypothetical protein M5W83_03535 [Paenibacillus thiaminolyticus]|uniref:Lipoprotein n=1 Tax=Paenibacillus thiaminolyticus TaxID=49283 RepID=A0AAP9DWX6_PANTH|nr:hypothetical protein [Paenibacillus thiaminolyticus]MCY9535320.1 hypothetical protein [Paenibacillus thiaminolyticus]MCY9602581.1 hypothetical protein [Paenibacillus thiaminolyticus]MCY9606233.1 hypothetical protein [Paenibacillus thiaminolyticus]MCY9612625.1 hypothetical protein [Paenibacillus thiaminolyticus]MCY9621463.1 hypothetical protein [Paenibacillus thiaminolyticus]